MGIKKIVLAYSGGLDTSIILKWLKQKYNAEIIAYVADVGQEDDYNAIEEKAFKTGASKVYIEDLRKEFVENYVFQALKANAIYENRYLLGTAIARPIIAKRQVEIALKEGADAVSHGATGKGNDQVRFELTFKSLAPNLKIIAPWREWEFSGREELIDFAKKNDIPIPVSKEKPYSMDRNLLHISFEGGILEDTWNEPKKDMFVLTKDPEDVIYEPYYLTIEFDKGIPVKLNGKSLSGLELMEKLNKIAGEYGVGRVDIVENRLVGIKDRGVYETPGGTVLHIAHKDLECITLDKDTMHYKEQIELRYSELIYNGKWFSPLKEALDAFINNTQKYVTGEVRLKLYKGSVIVVGRRSPYSLYNPELATFEEDEVYNQKDAEGFINLFGLQLREESRRKSK